MIRAAMAVPALLLTACFGGEVDLSPSGKGRPQVEVSFPEAAPSGSLQTMSITVTNPGPGDMEGVAVTFARVGNSYPIVDSGFRGSNQAVVAVEPEPVTVDSAGVVYRFGSLPEDSSATYEFVLRMPQHKGEAANSVTVSAAEDLERFRGLRLETELR